MQGYVGRESIHELIDYVDHNYLEFGAGNGLLGIGPDIEAIRQRAAEAGLKLVSMPIRHLGTERCYQILHDMHDFLEERVDIRTNTTVASFLIREGTVSGVVTADDEAITSKYVVVAPGREGSDWLVREAAELGLTMHKNPVDLGLRVEIPLETFQDLTDILYEPKLEYRSTVFNDRIRTFCVCPAGEVTMESTGGDEPVVTVNGHSYANHKTDRTNFALLVSAKFRDPFDDPITYGRSVARLANLLADGVIVQRYGDLQRGLCSQSSGIEDWKVQPSLQNATPGDINAVLPYRFLWGIKEMMGAIDRLAPGTASPDTLMYGIEVKFYSSRLHLTENLESEITNLFAIGDGAGVTRGLVQASASGVVAAREILRRSKPPSG